MRRPLRSALRLLGALFAAAFGVAVGFQMTLYSSASGTTGTTDARQTVFALLQPVAISNCLLQRFGEAHDGGYLMCGNLLQDAGVAYSYGIAGYDKWGCDISAQRKVTVHEYDCFDRTVPACPAGHTIFHAECLGDTAKTEQGRLFDTVANQLGKNGDGSKRSVMKIDVEGAEWNSFRAAPDELLQRIDQMAVEFHGVPDESVGVIRRLKRFFDVAHVHYNNATCMSGMEPLPAWSYEVLFVSKRLAGVNAAVRPDGAQRLDARNIPFFRDCQASAQ